MGCINNITFDNFPKQKDKNYRYPEFAVGSRVEVYYHFDNSKKHMGTIVRDDLEEPYETIIKLDNGRYLRGVECQFSYTERNDEPLECAWKESNYMGIDTYHTDCDKLFPKSSNIGNYNYCVYCGRNISVIR